MKFKIGSEAYEQVLVVEWLKVHNYKFTAVPNDVYTTSWSQKAKQKALWLNWWMSDLIIILKMWWLLFLEMKKNKWPKWWLNWSVISEKQLEWEKEMKKVDNCTYEFAHWYDEALRIIGLYDEIKL